MSKIQKRIQNNLLNSDHWNTVKPRQDDIIIASCYKSGTTLTQQIVHLLLNGKKDFESMRVLSPWIDTSISPPPPEPELVENLPSPRFLKSHLPFEALPYYPKWKYIYLGRDGRDVGLSLFDHCQAQNVYFKRQNKTNPLDNGPEGFSDFWDQWVETGKPRWDFWENVASWWKVRKLPNVLLVHYADLTTHKKTEAHRIADFLGCEWNDAIGEMVYQYSSIEYMKSLEMLGKLGSPDKNKKKTVFINKGISGRWKNLLTEQQIIHYKKVIYNRLESECADWLMYGRISDK